mmetsp:Transcript_12768/g.30193  ORF Transcript_12768/g.30193 Transcript_12768/m.30193 type:complete len:235 (-) Transcript_12768:253-957(-)
MVDADEGRAAELANPEPAHESKQEPSQEKGASHVAPGVMGIRPAGWQAEEGDKATKSNLQRMNSSGEGLQKIHKLGILQVFTEGPPVLDLYTIQRADGAMFIFSLLPLAADVTRLVRAGAEDSKLAPVWSDEFSFDLGEPAILVGMLVAFFQALEFLLRAVSRKRSLLYTLSKCLPPQGHGRPFPTVVRKFQSVQFFCMVLCGMIVRGLGISEAAVVADAFVSVSMAANWICNW